MSQFNNNCLHAEDYSWNRLTETERRIERKKNNFALNQPFLINEIYTLV